MTRVDLAFGTRRPYRAFHAARLCRAVAVATVPAGAGGAATALVLPNGSQAAAYWAFRTPIIADTAYAVPGGAVFVAPGGLDTNTGAAGAPLASIARAIAVVASGGTIVLRGGTYREQLGTITKRITIQPY